ncbi:Transcription initiation factor TFIID subunit 9 [Cryptotrichosporon argae]
MTNTPIVIPRDGRLISLICASKGIADIDERVIHQLLDFAHRYTADVLQSAQSLADHAARTGPQAARIEKEDVELAIQMRRRNEFFEPPPRDYLASLAHDLNSHPLPLLPESFDIIRLPPAHQRVTEVNFDIVPTALTAAHVAADDESASESSASEDDADGEEDEGAVAREGGEEGVDDEEDADEEMEEVGVPREVDEDYDM